MTTAQVSEAVVAPVSRRLRRASAAIGMHSVVDFFSFVFIALMPLLAVRLEMSKPDKALIIGIGAVTGGLIQPVVAWASDRLDTRVFGTIGMAVAVLCISAVGLAETYWQLLMLQAVGAAGIGAFHPVTAAAVGELAGRRRSRFVAIFFLAGMAGGVTGNTLTPTLVDQLSIAAGSGGAKDVGAGLRGLLWLLVPGLIGVGVLAWAIHGVSHRSSGAHAKNALLTRRDRRLRWGAVWLLYAGNVIRFTVNTALVYLIVEWTTRLAAERAAAGAGPDAVGLIGSQLNGPLQAAQQIGMGLGGLALGMLLPVRLEKRAFCVLPWLGVVMIVCLPMAGALPANWVMPIAFGVLILAGFGFGSLVPVSIALAQRLLPHRTSLASGLMMGGAWTISFLGPQFAGMMQELVGLERAFWAVGGLLCAAGVLAWFLPAGLLRDSDS